MTEKNKAIRSGKESVTAGAVPVSGKKLVRRKASPLQRTVYWLMMTLIIGLVGYVALEIGWIIYHQTGQ